MDSHIAFFILGSFECRVAGVPVRLRGPRQERMLVYLLLNRGRIVPVSRLVEAIWDDGGPDTAAHQVRKMISDLRSRAPALGEFFTTSGAGYSAQVQKDQLDLECFTEYLRLARDASADGALDQAVQFLREALALWRGPLLNGEGSLVIDAASVALQERHATAMEQFFELLLRQGHGGRLIGELREAVDEHPVRERMRGQLMLALWTSGRQAEALEEFQKIRHLLADVHGIDPGPGLCELHQRILRNDAHPEVSGPDQVSLEAAPGTALFRTPNTLPYDLPDFIGREEILASLYKAVETSAASGPRLCIIVLDGMGGSGKSAVAIHAAHRLRERYPDGQLYLDLQSFRADTQPVSAHDALGIALATIGVPGPDIPVDPATRAAMWHSTTADRRLLILLDNAYCAEQVRPLIPNTAGLAIVTSRAHIADLDGASQISVGLFSASDSRAFLSYVLGEERVSAESEAADQLIALCGDLPLALRISAARLLHRKHLSIGRLAERLRNDARRLHELDFASRSVAASILSSERALETGLRVALRRLSLHPGGTWDNHTASAILDRDREETEDILEILLDHHLIEHRALDRFAMHDLVRVTLSSGLGADSGPLDVHGDEMLRRLVAYYARVSGRACDIAFPGRENHPLPVPDYAGPEPVLEQPDQAIAWFDREYQALLALPAAIRETVPGTEGGIFHLSRNLSYYLHRKGLTEPMLQACLASVQAARSLGAPQALCTALTNLAVARWVQGDADSSIKLLADALDVTRSADYMPGEAICLNRLGSFHRALGNNVNARDYLEQAIPLHQKLGQHREEASGRISLCMAAMDLGHYPQAADQAHQAAELSRTLGLIDQQANALANLGHALLRCGKADEALDVLNSAYSTSLPFGESVDTALSLANLALAHLEKGQQATAAIYVAQASELLATTGAAPALSATIHNRLGAVQSALGELDAAREHHREALSLARQCGSRHGQARALAGLAAHRAAAGDQREAAELAARAEALFDALDTPAEVRGHP